jgi:hypothetical protein
VTAVTNINVTYRQHADLCMPVSGRFRVAVLRTSWMTTGAPFADITAAAGQKSALVTGAFAGTYAGSPPI